MVAANFPQCLAFVLREEGGNDDDPHDHGGRTSRGIIQREWNAWRAAHANIPLPEDVWQAPQTQIEAIYKEQYWEPYCDRLPGGLDLEFFDFCVNAGRTQAVKTLQKAVGVPVDGMMGIITWRAIEAANLHTLVTAYADSRRSFYRALAQFSRYGKGWMARTARCESLADKLAGEAPAPAKPAPAPSSPKANPKEIKKPPIQPEGGVVGSGGLIAILAQFKESLESLTGTPNVQYILLAIGVAVFAISLYGFWHRSQMQQQVG